MQKGKIRKIVFLSIIIAVFFATSGLVFVSQNIAEAANSKVTKWQTKLEKAGIDQSLWQKYMPKISRKECNKVMKAWKKAGGAAQTATTAQTEVAAQTSLLGPEIAVGLRYAEKSGTFKIDGNRAYNIKDGDGNIVAQVAADATTKVAYSDDGKLEVSDSVSPALLISDKVLFDATDGDNSTIIFDTHDGSDNRYRGKIEVNYYHGSDIYSGGSGSVTQIWIINKLPLEQYVWGMGETTGTGDTDHVRVMTTIFRTYGDWYIENATKYKPLGFKIRSDSGSQIYGGYDWEKDHPNIKSAAEDTRGRIIKYEGEVALTPYCSYTNGKTRALKGYPYLKSVKDHKAGIKKGLKAGDGGNHMWGLSAHGALGYAKDGKAWDWILKHYYTGVDIDTAY